MRLLGGSPFLVRRVRASCNFTPGSEKTRGYLVGAQEAAGWERMLRLYGARYVRRDAEGIVLFDEVAPQIAPGARPLDPAAWKIDDTAFRIAAFRDDPIDGPDERVNQYQFNLITDLPAYPKFWQMLAPASTCCNENMRQFGHEYVFFEMRRLGDGFVHRLPAVPSAFDIIFFGGK